MKRLGILAILLFLVLPVAFAADYTIQVNESFMNYSLRSANVTIGGVSNLTDSLGVATVYGLGASENYTVESPGYASKSGTMTPGEQQVLLTASSTGNVIMSFAPHITDSFDRPDNLTVDNGWTQSQVRGNITITDNRLNFSTWQASADVKLYRTFNYTQFNYVAFTIERQTVNPSNGGIANYFRSGGIAGSVVNFQDFSNNNDVRAYVGSPGNYETIGNITGFTPHLIEYYFNKTTNNTIDLYIDGVFNQTTYTTNIGDDFNTTDTLIINFGSADAHTDLLDNILFGNVEEYVCAPSWSCTGYSSTCIAGGQACNAVTDANLCGDAYAGNYSEFTPQLCSDTQYAQHSPLNGSTHTPPVLFNVTVTTNSSLPMNCTFYVNDSSQSVETIAASPTTITNLLNLSVGAYTWKTNCTDATTSETFNLNVCVANWTCNGYSACIASTQHCTSVTDQNTCGYAYAGNYSEFPAQSCVGPVPGSAALSVLMLELVIAFLLFIIDAGTPNKSRHLKEFFRYAYIILIIVAIITLIGVVFGA